MKLLLTSNGLANKSIIAALFELVGEPAGEMNAVFIPTAADAEADDKSWLIKDLVNIKNQNFKQIDIVDIAALPKESWQPRLEHADILFFGSDVDGIYDNKKETIKEINKENISQYTKAIGESKHIDVTGGMRNKLEKVQQYKNKYITYIFNLNKEKALYNNLIGKYNGTKIEL